MGEFRFVVLGAGNIAKRFCSAVKQVEGCCVAAVASKSLAKAEAFAKECGVAAFYGSYEEMLLGEKPDAAYIATTPDAHYALSMLCVQHGVPVICEKAMFTCGAEAEACFAAAREKGVFMMEALWSRFLPAVNAAKAWLKDGRIGEPVMAEIGLGFVAPKDPEARYLNPKLAGGCTTDITVYGYEVLTWVLDRAVERESIEAVATSRGVDASEIVMLRFAGNVPAVIKCSFMTKLEETMVIYGTEGKIVVPHPHYASEAMLYDAKGEVAEAFRDMAEKDGFTYEIGEVVRCVRAGLLESDVVPQADTLACARLFDRIRAAM